MISHCTEKQRNGRIVKDMGRCGKRIVGGVRTKAQDVRGEVFRPMKYVGE
jgi:hypothetical protein